MEEELSLAASILALVRDVHKHLVVQAVVLSEVIGLLGHNVELSKC
jgi:hypothetical protein